MAFVVSWMFPAIRVTSNPEFEKLKVQTLIRRIPRLRDEVSAPVSTPHKIGLIRSDPARFS
jgi:hypothetical protein